MTPNEVEKEIRKAVTSVREAGVEIRQDLWGVYISCNGKVKLYGSFTGDGAGCCILGAVLLVEGNVNDSDMMNVLCDKFDLSAREVEAIYTAFDGIEDAVTRKYPALAAIGRKLRAELFPECQADTEWQGIDPHTADTMPSIPL